MGLLAREDLISFSCRENFKYYEMRLDLREQLWKRMRLSTEGIGPKKEREPGFVYSGFYMTQKSDYATSQIARRKRAFLGSCVSCCMEFYFYPYISDIVIVSAYYREEYITESTNYVCRLICRLLSEITHCRHV
jgi:hypothetical protein